MRTVELNLMKSFIDLSLCCGTESLQSFLTGGGESVPRDLFTTCTTIAPTCEANA